MENEKQVSSERAYKAREDIARFEEQGHTLFSFLVNGNVNHAGVYSITHSIPGILLQAKR